MKVSLVLHRVLRSGSNFPFFANFKIPGSYKTDDKGCRMNDKRFEIKNYICNG
jgi:hypothetical protein